MRLRFGELDKRLTPLASFNGKVCAPFCYNWCNWFYFPVRPRCSRVEIPMGCLRKEGGPANPIVRGASDLMAGTCSDWSEATPASWNLLAEAQIISICTFIHARTSSNRDLRFFWFKTPPVCIFVRACIMCIALCMYTSAFHLIKRLPELNLTINS